MSKRRPDRVLLAARLKHISCGDGGVVATGDEKLGPLLIKFGDKGGDRRKWGGH